MLCCASCMILWNWLLSTAKILWPDHPIILFRIRIHHPRKNNPFNDTRTHSILHSNWVIFIWKGYFQEQPVFRSIGPIFFSGLLTFFHSVCSNQFKLFRLIQNYRMKTTFVSKYIRMSFILIFFVYVRILFVTQILSIIPYNIVILLTTTNLTQVSSFQIVRVFHKISVLRILKY